LTEKNAAMKSMSTTRIRRNPINIVVEIAPTK
jgi:hypothetical protein